MSLYNLVFGKNPFSTLLLEILGTTEDQVPRFRDCYLDEEGRIVIHTRTGGGNRMFHEHPDLCKKEFPAMFEDPEEAPSGPWNSDLRKLPGFMYDRDDGFDTTYADFVYEVPEAFKSQVELLSNFGAVSNPAERWQSLLDDLKKGDTDSEEAKRALKVGERLMAQINEALNQNT